MSTPEATFYDFVYFDREEFPYATSRSIWSCGGYFFLVSSIVNYDMDAVETMVFACNSIGEKLNGSEDLAYSPDPRPDADAVKELVQRAYLNRTETILREELENFIRYEASPDQLESIKTMFVNPRVFD